MIQGRLIILSEAQYLAGTYALHSAWDEVAQGLNNEVEQLYEVPLERALEDARIVRLIEQTPEAERASYHRDCLLFLPTPREWNPPK